ncbi:hypothetical protein [Ferruginibacter sp.]|nr:hypothetical protein [Ferruginibacter sp.]
MEKTYKVTQKIYFNDRLKKVFFHGVPTYPLYVQLTFDRKTIVFKSYYFDLFSKPRYVIFMNGSMHGPTIKEIIKKETELIDFIIDKNLADCSLEKLKADYTFYCKDLCDEMETGFIDYLFIFFQDKGIPALATTIKEGIKFRIAYEVVRDLKIALVPSLYSELIANSFYYAPPYPALYGFMQQIKKWPVLCLTVMEWQDNKIKTLFTHYLNENYKNLDAVSITGQINKFIKALK